MGPGELTGALADPHEVAREVVVLLGARVEPAHGVLVLQHQRLVGDVEVDVVELVGVGADRLHERHRPVDLVRHGLVAQPRGRLRDEVGVPGVHLAQVGVAAGDEGADHAQRRRRRAVHLEQPRGVGQPGLRCELEAVDGVTAVRRQRHAGTRLEVGGAGLGVLAREPAELDHRHRGGVRQHHGHLQQHAQLVAGVVGRHAGEGLGAVAALQQERLAACDGGELGPQLVALRGEDERARGAQRGDRGVDGRGVGVRRLLGRVERMEGGQVGEGHDPTLRGASGPRGRRRPAAAPLTRRRPRPRRTPRARRA